MDEFDLALMSASEQGSDNWFDVRAGRFTSSEIHRLMKSGSRLMTATELAARPKEGKGSKSKYIEDPNEMSPDTVTYIRQKVAETLTGMAPQPTFSHATAHGDTWEPYAAEYYSKTYKVDLEPAGFKVVGDHAGGSIDRKIVGVNEFLEIKCPYNSANQVGYLSLVDQWDLKRENPEYYWQAMSNLYFGGFDLCHFATFDPRMKADKHKLFVMKIKPIAEDIDLINTKLEVAVREKLILLKSLQ